jgi:S-adenosylmethionine decarboxylase
LFFWYSNFAFIFMSDALGLALPAVTHRDYFSECNGQRFAGTHLILDLWDAKYLNDAISIEAALREAARSSKATVLHGHFHVFTPLGGVTGVLLLAESHISIHTWPEHSFAAIDLFMCAGCNPRDGIDALKRWFAPQRISVKTLRRGISRTAASPGGKLPNIKRV